jgi:hypothetical protein
LNVAESDILPMKPEKVQLWLTELACVKKLAYKTIKTYLSGAITIASQMGYPNTIKDNEAIAFTIRGIKRTIGENAADNGKRLRLPITTTIIQQVIRCLPKAMNRNYNQKLILAAMVTGTYGLMRAAEFVSTNSAQQVVLCVENLKLYNPQRELLNLATARGTELQCCQYYTINLTQSKVDPFKHGTIITISNSIAVSALIDYLLVHPSLKNPHSTLFVNRNGSDLSRRELMGQVRILLRLAGVPNVESYKGHSFRKGGAQSLKDKGYSDDIIQKMGRWSSDAHLLYATNNVDFFTSISNNM